MRQSIFVLFLLIGFAGLLIRSGALEKPLAVARLAMDKPPEALPLPITVGDTGNARGTPSHLHYGVYAAGHGAINPFPLLARQQAVSHTAAHQAS